jgi:hypothetical protein
MCVSISQSEKTKAALPYLISAYHGLFEGLPATFTESYLSDVKSMRMHESYLIYQLKLSAHALDRTSFS